MQIGFEIIVFRVVVESNVQPRNARARRAEPYDLGSNTFGHRISYGAPERVPLVVGCATNKSREMSINERGRQGSWHHHHCVATEVRENHDGHAGLSLKVFAKRLWIGWSSQSGTIDQYAFERSARIRQGDGTCLPSKSGK